MFKSNRVPKKVPNKPVKLMNPGDTFSHSGVCWMVIDPTSIITPKDIGLECIVWAVCLEDGDTDRIGDVSYFGDGDPFCTFPTLEVEAIISKPKRKE